MDRKKYSRDYLVKKGINPIVAAGIIGNLDVESGFSDDVISFKRRGDNGSAYGLAQWRGDRKDNLLKFAGNRANTIEGQLDFLVHELTTNKAYKYETINSAKSPSEAAKLFMDIYERPNKNPKINHIAKRMKVANELAGVTVSDIEYEDSKVENSNVYEPKQHSVEPQQSTTDTLPYIDVRTEADKAKDDIKYVQATEDLAKQQYVQQTPESVISQPEYNYLQDTNLFTIQ